MSTSKYATRGELTHGRSQDYPLTSGKSVRVRRATLQMLIAEGRIPNPLRPLVLSIESGARGKSLEEHPESLTETDLEEFETLRDSVLSICIEEPALSPAEVRDAFNPDDREGLWEFTVHLDVMVRVARFRELAGLGVESAGNGGGAKGS